MPRIQSLKRDSKGYLYRNLGWFSQEDGQHGTQPKFCFGRDEAQAIERLRRLERMWELVEQNFEPTEVSKKPTWEDETLRIAKAISRGEHTYCLRRQNLPGKEGEDAAHADADYAGYLRAMQDAYPVITFIPDDAAAFQNGLRKNLEMAESKQFLADEFAKDARQPSVRDMRETLHKAINAFVEAIEQNPKV